MEKLSNLYRIICIESKYSYDGKKHYIIYKLKGKNEKTKEPIWENPVNRIFDTYMQAKEVLKTLN